MGKKNILSIILIGFVCLCILYFVGQKVIGAIYVTYPLYVSNISAASEISEYKKSKADRSTYFDTEEYISEYIIQHSDYTLSITNVIHGNPRITFSVISKMSDKLLISNKILKDDYKCTVFGGVYGTKAKAVVGFGGCEPKQKEEMAAKRSRLKILFDVVNTNGDVINTEQIEIYIEQNGYMRRMDSL